jgi:hypothetical protein
MWHGMRPFPLATTRRDGEIEAESACGLSGHQARIGEQRTKKLLATIACNGSHCTVRLPCLQSSLPDWASKDF